MAAEFRATESILLSVPADANTIGQYLAELPRIVQILCEPSRYELFFESSLLPPSHVAFRMMLQPLKFLHLTIQPDVEMEAWLGTNHSMQLRSTHTEIRGVDFLSTNFHLKLRGHLHPEKNHGKSTKLAGSVSLQLTIDLPTSFTAIPPTLIEVAGNRLLKSILVAMKLRLERRLIVDFKAWLHERKAAEHKTILGA